MTKFNVDVKMHSWPLQSEKTTTLNCNAQELVCLCRLVNSLSYLSDYENDIILSIEKVEERWES